MYIMEINWSVWYKLNNGDIIWISEAKDGKKFARYIDKWKITTPEAYEGRDYKREGEHNEMIINPSSWCAATKKGLLALLEMGFDVSDLYYFELEEE